MDEVEMFGGETACQAPRGWWDLDEEPAEDEKGQPDEASAPEGEPSAET